MTAEDAPYGPDWSASLRRGTDAGLRHWVEVAQAACDETDPIARRYFRRDLRVESERSRASLEQHAG